MAQNQLSNLPAELRLEVAIQAMGPGPNATEAALATSMSTYLRRYYRKHNGSIFRLPGFLDLWRKYRNALTVSEATIFVKTIHVSYDDQPQFFDGVANHRERRKCYKSYFSGIRLGSSPFLIPVKNGRVCIEYLPSHVSSAASHRTFNKLTELTIVADESRSQMMAAITCVLVVPRPALRKIRLCSLSYIPMPHNPPSWWDVVFQQGLVPGAPFFQIHPHITPATIQAVLQRVPNLDEMRFDMMRRNGRMASTTRARDPSNPTGQRWINYRTTWVKFWEPKWKPGDRSYMANTRGPDLRPYFTVALFMLLPIMSVVLANAHEWTVWHIVPTLIIAAILAALMTLR